MRSHVDLLGVSAAGAAGCRMSTPSTGDREAGSEEEVTYRANMQYVTDPLWALGAHELGMAVLHDVIDDAEARRIRQTEE
jgi:hypothetical protein